jgi:murein DD-endopeptidase MepM/ murein hydrolase activator NlpD
MLPSEIGSDLFRAKSAYAVTSAEKQAEADALMKQLDELQTELNKINADYAAAVAAHDEAEAKMIDAQERVAAAEIRIQELQLQLGNRASQMYKQGPGTFLDVVFGAKSFLDFITTMDLMSRISEQDAALVAESKIVRAQAEAARIEYTEAERTTSEKEIELAGIKTQLDITTTEMSAQVEELSKQAAELLAQEILQAEEAKRRAEQEAREIAAGGKTVSDEQLGHVPVLIHPCPDYTYISSEFGWRDFDNAFHLGVDFAGPVGTPIYATAGGTVTAAGWHDLMGSYVIINHGSGVRTIYMHNSSLLVAAGAAVEQGDKIALMGSTGNSTGSHLHFQLEIDGVAVNPMLFLPLS